MSTQNSATCNESPTIEAFTYSCTYFGAYLHINTETFAEAWSANISRNPFCVGSSSLQHLMKANQAAVPCKPKQAANRIANPSKLQTGLQTMAVYA